MDMAYTPDANDPRAIKALTDSHKRLTTAIDAAPVVEPVEKAFTLGPIVEDAPMLSAFEGDSLGKGRVEQALKNIEVVETITTTPALPNVVAVFEYPNLSDIVPEADVIVPTEEEFAAHNAVFAMEEEFDADENANVASDSENIALLFEMIASLTETIEKLEMRIALYNTKASHKI